MVSVISGALEDRFGSPVDFLTVHCCVVQYLCQSNVSVNPADNEGHTPLHAAAEYGSLELVKLLCKVGADTSRLTVHGESPLQLASKKRHRDVVACILGSIQRNR